MTKTATKLTAAERTHPVVLHGEERGKIWEKAQGMWKDRKPDPVKEHRKIRKEWDGKFSSERPPFVSPLDTNAMIYDLENEATVAPQPNCSDART